MPIEGLPPGSSLTPEQALAFSGKLPDDLRRELDAHLATIEPPSARTAKRQELMKDFMGLSESQQTAMIDALERDPSLNFESAIAYAKGR